MKKYIFLILVIFAIAMGCDFSSHVKENISQSEKEAKVEMDKQISKAKVDFEESFSLTINPSHESRLLADLYSSINETSNYLDSLRIELNKLDNIDTRNVELIKQLFLYNGIGDSVFTKVKHSYSLIIDIATSDTMKARLIKVKETYTEETKRHFFEPNGPLGVSIILYGIELELLTDVRRSLTSYKTK